MPRGLSDCAIVTKEFVELTETRCWRGVVCEPLPRAWPPAIWPSFEVESLGAGGFAVLFREPIHREFDSDPFVPGTAGGGE